MSRKTQTLAASIAALALVATGCSAGTPADKLTHVKVLLPVQAPLEYPHQLAEALGFNAEEGIEASFEYAGGSAEVIQQLVGGNGDIGITCASAIAAAFGEGFTQIRPVFTTVYGGVFGLAVPADSNVNDVADLRGQTIGISDPAGGEVPVVKGIMSAGGVDESEYELLAIGEGTAVALRAIENGDVQAVGGSFADFVGLQMQGLELRNLSESSMRDLPACAVVVTDDDIEENSDIIEGFLRATAKAVLWGQQNPERTLEILREKNPDTYAGESGELLMHFYMPVLAPPDENTVGAITPDSYAAYFDFTGVEMPEGLDDLIDDRFIAPANDFDRSELASVE